MKNHIVAALLLPLSCLSAADSTTTAARAVNDLALDLLLTPPNPKRTQPFPLLDSTRPCDDLCRR